MENRKLKEFVSFIPGINQSRAEKQFGEQEIIYYDQSSFEIDYNQIELESEGNDLSDLSLSKGDIVISNSLQKAVIVGNSNVGKVLSLNFTKVHFEDKSLDKHYFLYLFNEYKGIQRQKERELQGIGPVLRLTRQSLEQFIFPFVPYEEQKKLGKIYIESLKIQGQMNRYASLMKYFIDSILEENLRE